MMTHWVKSLDGLLRGDTTRLTALGKGTVEVPASGLAVLIMVLGAFYGACMACFAAFNRPFGMALLQMIASAGKIPLLFFLTLFVTFPSLYVFNALVGSRLTLRATWQLLISTLAVMMAVLASLGPVVAFFSVSTTGYSFMLIFNVVICAAAGFLGLKFLLFTLHRLTIALDSANSSTQSTAPQNIASQRTTSQINPPSEIVTQVQKRSAVEPEKMANADALLPNPNAGSHTLGFPNAVEARGVQNSPRGALEKMEGRTFSGNVTAIFRVWVVVFALVGAQMSWVLRPFIGAPDVAFAWLRARDSNFFEAVLHAIGMMLGGR